MKPTVSSIPQDLATFVSEQAGLSTSWRVISDLSNWRRNRCWLIESESERLVLRTAGKLDGPLGVDRRREIASHRAAAEAGIAPPIVFADPERGVIITRFEPGQPCDTAVSEQRDALARCLKYLHELPAVEAQNDLIATVENDARRTDQLSHELAAELQAVFEEYRGLSVLSTLCHCDPIPENTLYTDERVVLLDWEYAQAADPYFDLAAVVEEHALDAEQTRQLLAVYGIEAADADRRLFLLRVLYRVLALVWYCKLAATANGTKTLTSDAARIQLAALRVLLTQNRNAGR